jgi:membrane peptidoglycan carboxypeptidase
MPQATRIIKWRQRRAQRSRRTGKSWLKIGAGLLVALLGLGLFSLLGVGGATAVAYTTFTQDLPDYNQIETLGQTTDTFETSKIYALGPANNEGTRDWVLIYEVIDPLGGDRQWVQFNQLPQAFVDATVAIEDRTFWTNQGYDMQGIGRAFYEYIWLGGAIQGGSSITQQLIKNNLIEPERRVVQGDPGWDDYRRKIEEILLANRMSQEYTKEQILEWYVNSNFYGNLAYGIEAAARVYFNKTAAELTLAEAAMLAAIPQSPALNPIDAPDQAKARQELVLDAMYREGMITREELVAAKFTPLQIAPSLEERFDIIAPHYAIKVRQELEQKFGAERVLRGGLRVYTALDLDLQNQAECVARAHVARLSGALGAGLPADEASSCPAIAFLPTPNTAELGQDRNVNNASVVMIDPTTGELKAMVGSLNYWDESIDGSFNVAADGLRQPGSSFKPFTYLTAFAQGYTPATMVLDVETDFGTEYNGVAYVPQNYDRIFHGPMSIRQALGNSYNVPAVEVMSWVGVDNVIRTAHKMGITSLDKGPNQYGLIADVGRRRSAPAGYGVCVQRLGEWRADDWASCARSTATAGLPHVRTRDDFAGGGAEWGANL